MAGPPCDDALGASESDSGLRTEPWELAEESDVGDFFAIESLGLEFDPDLEEGLSLLDVSFDFDCVSSLEGPSERPLLRERFVTLGSYVSASLLNFGEE